jgi:ubiquinone/menaquinone biosynthesis C-methylase UbiE
MLYFNTRTSNINHRKTNEMDLKNQVKDFWNGASCGEELLLPSKDAEGFNQQRLKRYQLEPMILSFADFDKYNRKKVLEIGVGLGCEHQMFAENGADLYGIDLTPRAIENTQKRFDIFNLKSNLAVGDAENLAFENDTFDLVFSWGVMHHSPHTQQCFDEAFRVLKSGGEAKIMVYHRNSITGYMLWIRYGLMKLKPFMSLNKIYENYMESIGTKAFTVSQMRKMFHKFSEINITTHLTHSDLLTSGAGQRHQGIILTIAKKMMPRFLIKTFFPSHGLFMLVHARK